MLPKVQHFNRIRPKFKVLPTVAKYVGPLQQPLQDLLEVPLFETAKIVADVVDAVDAVGVVKQVLTCLVSF